VADVVVVGGGVGGLAAALRLRAAGHAVRVLERRPALGGKLDVRVRHGFTFDTGPSLLTLPGLMDELFRVAGTRLTANLNASMTANQVEDILQTAFLNSAFALDIVVERFVGTDGVVFVVYFQGVLRDTRGGPGAPFFNVQIDGTPGATTVKVDSLMDGIQYFGLEQLDINMGAGVDVVNVQGTTAVTSIRTDATTNSVPMDRIETIYVSSDADLDRNLQGNLLAGGQNNFDLLSGNLENILGRLDIDAGQGRNRIWISDESDTTGDTATITDQPVAPSVGGIVSEINITGLSPAPIGFRANGQSNGTGGNFAGGVTIWTGRDGDTITIDGTHNRPTAINPAGTPMRTVTTVNRLSGDDRVTEIARMMGGSAAGEKALDSARELLDRTPQLHRARTGAKGESESPRRKRKS